jgi:hypothetical protein
VALPPAGVLTIRSSDSEHVVAVYRPLVLAYFSRPPSDGELGILRGIIKEGRAEELRGGMLFAVARRDASGGIQPRVRKFFEETVKENSGHFGATATVVLMKGFAASLMRSFLTGLLVLIGKRDQFQVFASVEDACRWLAPKHGMDAAKLLQTYQKAIANIAQ